MARQKPFTSQQERLERLIKNLQSEVADIKTMVDVERGLLTAQILKVDDPSSPQIIRISEGGNLMLGSEGVRQQPTLDPASARFPDSNAPAVSKIAGTNRVMLALGYDQTVSQKACWHFLVGDPGGGIVKYYLDWTATGGTPGQKVVFDVVAYGVADGEVYTTGGSSDSVSVTDTLIAANDLHRVTVSAESASPFDANHHTFIEVSRDPDDADDNLAAKAWFLGGLVELRGA